MEERIQKVLSRWGLASRRHAEQLVQAGRVHVNGQVATIGQKIDPDRDQVILDGVAVQPDSALARIYLLLNKPAGYVSTCDDPQGRATVLDLLPEHLRQGQGIHPVGRLDFASTGALLLTNDGDLTFYLTHPRHHIPKTYHVWVEGHPSAATLQQWRQGVQLDDRQTRPAEVQVIRQHPQPKTLLQITLREGRNRQIRRIAEQLGHPVIQLHRTEIGTIHLTPPGRAGLPTGAYRSLTTPEIDSLRAQIGLTSVRASAERKEYR